MESENKKKRGHHNVVEKKKNHLLAKTINFVFWSEIFIPPFYMETKHTKDSRKTEMPLI